MPTRSGRLKSNIAVSGRDRSLHQRVAPAVAVKGGEPPFATKGMLPREISLADIRPTHANDDCNLRWYLAMLTQG